MNPPNSSRLTDADRLDAYLGLLADTDRRQLIVQLQAHPRDSITLQELTTQLTTTTAERDRLRLCLHHIHLPKLAEAGILDYDSITNTIEYHGDPELEFLLDTIERNPPLA